MPRVGQPRGVDCCGSLYTLSFPGSDVSLGDEIGLVVERLEEGKREVAVRSNISEKSDPFVLPLVSSFGIHRQLKLSQLIFPLANRSCNISHSKPKQISTNSNDVAENYCRNWTPESSSLNQNAVVPTNPTTTFSYSLLKHASALSIAQRQQISLRLLKTTTQRQLLTSPLLNANIQR
ncbi:hypothetical protein F511_31698 [Dorcoceras hygrometricum]|uniref:Uncharacterized protein n=1 Tax=Dorcoceras hygrometricum TaxID=472368 RepID=A0A2Z7AXX6_9LAMI|nr:hypothetical protein F511_31698 [Dorcoceras hygrometricum]